MCVEVINESLQSLCRVCQWHLFAVDSDATLGFVLAESGMLPRCAQSIRYRPLYFRSRRVEAVELVPDGVAVSNPMQQPVHVTVEVSTSGGR